MSKHFVMKKDNYYLTRDGLKFKSEQAAIDHSAQRRAEISERIDGELTDREWDLQFIDSATDSRSMAEKMSDNEWSPKLKDELASADKQISDLEAAGAKRRASEEYRGLNLEERLALDLRKKREREQGEQQAERSEAAYLKSMAGKLEEVETLIRGENWNPESDERFRVLLRKVKATLIEPGHDPTELARLFSEVDEVRVTRQMNEQAGIAQDRERLNARSARNAEPLMLLSTPEPAPEHVPDPHGFDDPMSNYRPETVEAEQLPRASIDTNRDLKYQVMDLGYTAAMENWPLSVWKEIEDASDALKAGDQVPAMEVLERYAQPESATD